MLVQMTGRRLLNQNIEWRDIQVIAVVGRVQRKYLKTVISIDCVFLLVLQFVISVCKYT